MTETQIKKRLRMVGANAITFLSIETGSTTRGFPDTYFYMHKPPHRGLMEVKHIPTIIKKDTIKVPWRSGQLGMGQRLVRAHENLWLCMVTDDTKDMFFIPGIIWAERYIVSHLRTNKIIPSGNYYELRLEHLHYILTQNQY